MINLDLVKEWVRKIYIYSISIQKVQSISLSFVMKSFIFYLHFNFIFLISAQEFHIQTVCRRWCYKLIGISVSSSHVLDFWPCCIYFYTCSCNKIYRRLELPGFSLLCIYYSHNYWIWWLSCRYYLFSFFILSKLVHDI